MGMRSVTPGLVALALVACTSNAMAECPHNLPPKATPEMLIGCFNEIAKLRDELAAMRSELDRVKTSLYDDIDNVYTVSYTFKEEQVKAADPATGLKFPPLYIFANMQKHRVSLVLNRRNNTFSVRVCVNGAEKSCKIYQNNIRQDITDLLKNYPLKPSYAGEESEELDYPENLQFISLSPLRMNWEARPESSIEGYVLVRRLSGPDK